MGKRARTKKQGSSATLCVLIDHHANNGSKIRGEMIILDRSAAAIVRLSPGLRFECSVGFRMKEGRFFGLGRPEGVLDGARLKEDLGAGASS